MFGLRADLPINEVERLAALYSYDVVDSEREEAFDDLARLAAYLCRAPISAISLTEDTREWFKSALGIEASETPIDQAFSAHAILNPDHPLIVPDAREDDRFRDNALVVGAPGVRFYVGIPLVDASGFALGAISVIDVVPRELQDVEVAMLQALARQTVAQIQLRKANASMRRQATALETVREEALRAMRSHGSLLRSTANELQAILQQAAGDAVTLLTHPQDDAALNRLARLQTTLEEGLRASNLIGDLVDLEAARHKRPTAPVQVVRLFRTVAAECDVEIESLATSGMDDDTVLSLDGFAFSTLARALCSGLPRPVHAHVTFSFLPNPGGDKMHLTISAPHALRSEFAVEPFGLQAARRVVDLLDGRFESEIGTNNVFLSVELPAAQRSVKNEDATSPRGARRETHVLVAEDNQVNVMVIQAMLEERGYAVTCVSSGREAVEQVASNEFDLVLMDIQMPELDGIEATRLIRRQGGKLGLLPIIALTANATEEDRNACLEAGMNDYISKPYKPVTLTETLQRWGLTRT